MEKIIENIEENNDTITYKIYIDEKNMSYGYFKAIMANLVGMTFDVYYNFKNKDNIKKQLKEFVKLSIESNPLYFKKIFEDGSEYNDVDVFMRLYGDKYCDFFKPFYELEDKKLAVYLCIKYIRFMKNSVYTTINENLVKDTIKSVFGNFLKDYGLKEEFNINHYYEIYESNLAITRNEYLNKHNFFTLANTIKFTEDELETLYKYGIVDITSVTKIRLIMGLDSRKMEESLNNPDIVNLFNKLIYLYVEDKCHLKSEISKFMTFIRYCKRGSYEYLKTMYNILLNNFNSNNTENYNKVKTALLMDSVGEGGF